MYDVEFQGIKNGKMIRRFKEKGNIDYDESGIFINGIVYEYAKLERSYDRIKLIVDGEEWINKVFLDFLSYKIGNEYEFSDDGISWTKMKLVGIDKDSEYPFTAKKDLLNFGWRFAREIIY